MTRKVVLDLTDAVGTFMSKTNLMSDFVGDLDNLDSGFKIALADSSIVGALNKLSADFDSISNRLFGGATADLHVRNFTGDSATFTTLRVGQLMADSATIDSASIQNLAVGGIVVDSARFTDNFRIDSIGIFDGGTLTIDSATLTNVVIKSLQLDSAKVDRLTANTGTIRQATIDSATITNLDVSNLDVDSAHFNVLTADSAFYNGMTVDSAAVSSLNTNNIIINGLTLDNLKRFTIKNEAGTAVLDGYFLSTSSTPGTA